MMTGSRGLLGHGGEPRKDCSSFPSSSSATAGCMGRASHSLPASAGGGGGGRLEKGEGLLPRLRVGRGNPGLSAPVKPI